MNQTHNPNITKKWIKAIMFYIPEKKIQLRIQLPTQHFNHCIILSTDELFQ